MFEINRTPSPKYQQANSHNWSHTFLLIRLGEVTPEGYLLLIKLLSPEYQLILMVRLGEVITRGHVLNLMAVNGSPGLEVMRPAYQYQGPKGVSIA